MSKPIPRPPEFPAETYKVWTQNRWADLSLFISATGTAKEIRSQLNRLSVWETAKPMIEDLKREAKKHKVEGLRFQVEDDRPDYDESSSLKVTALGFKPKTEKELLAGASARQKNAIKAEAAASKKKALELAQLAELLRKYPEGARS